MSLTKRHAREIVAENMSLERGIPVDAVYDILDRIQDLIYDYRFGVGEYESEDEILTDFGIPVEFGFIFD